MDPWSNLPDEIRWRIFRFLSTPTADIINRDVKRQLNLYFNLNVKDPGEFLELYSCVYFAERKYAYVRFLLREHKDYSHPLSRAPFIRDLLRSHNLRLIVVGDNDYGDEDVPDSDDDE